MMTHNTCGHEVVEIKELLNRKKIPYHIAIIMDGNRRWAALNQLPAERGHWKGAETLMCIVEAGCEVGVKVLTVYAFSTENWKRSKKEIETLMEVFRSYLIKMRPEMVKNQVKLETIGDIEKFPEGVKEALRQTKEATANCDKMTLILALNYGARSEMTRAVKKLLFDFSKKKFAAEELNEELFASYLDTRGYADPDLLIRTSGENRISNFLLWQISYAEVYVTKTLWPDFSREDFFDAIYDFQKRDRRVGL